MVSDDEDNHQPDQENGSDQATMEMMKKLFTMGNQKLPAFTGEKQDIRILDWFDSYEAATDGFDDEMRLKRLPSYLNGFARRIFNVHCKAKNLNYEDTKAVLITAIQPSNKRALKQKLQDCKQHARQTLDHFVTEVLDLCLQLDENMSDSDKIDYILEGVDSEIKYVLCNKEYDDLDRFMEKARVLERTNQR